MTGVLAVTCPSCGVRSLVSLRRVLALTSSVDEHGRTLHRVDYRCRCGRSGTELITGPEALRPPRTTAA